MNRRDVLKLLGVIPGIIAAGGLRSLGLRSKCESCATFKGGIGNECKKRCTVPRREQEIPGEIPGIDSPSTDDDLPYSVEVFVDGRYKIGEDGEWQELFS
jgi:hypothetical protein